MFVWRWRCLILLGKCGELCYWWSEGEEERADQPSPGWPCLSCLAAGDALLPRQRLDPAPATAATTNRPTKFSFMFWFSKRKLELQGWMPSQLSSLFIRKYFTGGREILTSVLFVYYVIMSFNKLKLIRKCGSLLFQWLTLGQPYKSLDKTKFSHIGKFPWMFARVFCFHVWGGAKERTLLRTPL